MEMIEEKVTTESFSWAIGFYIVANFELMYSALLQLRNDNLLIV